MDIPYDVWLRIVYFLPGYFVRTLFTVNRALFEIAMDERYREVEITIFDEWTLWLLFRLRDPSIASRVRSLRIQPYIQNYTRDLWWMKCESSSQPLVARVRKAVNRALNPVRQWHAEKIMVGFDRASLKKIYMSFDDMIGGMIDAFLTFSHVSEFVVEEYDQSPVYDIRPLYGAAWAGFGSNLRKLSLKRDMESFADVLHPSSLHFPQLQEVSITFIYTRAGMSSAGDTIREIVAPFINRHKSTIRVLSFASEDPMGLSVLFVSLCLFPALQRIALELSFDDTVWSTNSGFARFLRDHAETLRHIELGGGIRSKVPESLVFHTWIRDNASDGAIFDGLDSLIIPTIHKADFNSVKLAIRTSIDKLTKLALVGRYLSTGEVQTVVEMFSHRALHGRLRSLQLNVENLAPSLLQLVDSHFPKLQELDLSFMCLSSRNQPRDSHGLVDYKFPRLLSPEHDLVSLSLDDIASIPGNTLTITRSSVRITRSADTVRRNAE